MKSQEKQNTLFFYESVLISSHHSDKLGVLSIYMNQLIGSFPPISVHFVIRKTDQWVEVWCMILKTQWLSFMHGCPVEIAGSCNDSTNSHCVYCAFVCLASCRTQTLKLPAKLLPLIQAIYLTTVITNQSSRQKSSTLK